MEKKVWSCKKTDPELVQEIQHRFNYPRIVAELLVGRGIMPDEVDVFVKAPLSNITDPYRIPGIIPAVARIWEAIANKEPILIHGDYDTDGITATALLSAILQKNGANVHTFLPHRFDDGYGFTPESLKKSIESMDVPPSVLITVDCGITSCDAVEAAKTYNVLVIITDHHEPSEIIPDAYAVINPKIDPTLTDLHPLSGVGMAFKLCHAFIKYGREKQLGGHATNLQEVLDFVALGTVADIVPLRGENRIMVKHGIRVLKQQIRPGIRALVEMAHLRSYIKPADITFKLAPRLNAAGRLGNAEIALNLLRSENIVDAYKYADQLEKLNLQRQETEENIYSQALARLHATMVPKQRYSIVVAGENWHQGVIGIVASRLARDFNRPAIVLAISGDEAQGSGRSIGPLNLVKVLSECNHLLNRFGGHPMAVGLGLHRDKIEEFTELFEEVISRELDEADLVHRLEADTEVEIEELHDIQLYRHFDAIAPFGHGNPHPHLMIRAVAVERVFPILNGRHIRGTFIDSMGCTIDFIAFNRGLDSIPEGLLDIVVTPSLNEHGDNQKPQVQIIDWRPSEPKRFN